MVNSIGKIIGHVTPGPGDAVRLESHSYIPECGLTLTSAFKQAAPFNGKIRIATKHHKWLKIIDAGWTGSYLAEEIFYYRMHNKNFLE